MKAATTSGIKPQITVSDDEGDHVVDIYTQDGFDVLADLFTRSGWQRKVSYEVTWLGIPIIQLPEDIVIVQELVWRVRPEVIVECGVAHGGALILYASLLELLGRGRVVGIDVEIRKYNRLAIESHPMAKRITLVEGSSTDPSVVDALRESIEPGQVTMVMLDFEPHPRPRPGRAGAVRPARVAGQLHGRLRRGHADGRRCAQRAARMGRRQPARGGPRLPDRPTRNSRSTRRQSGSE